MKRAKGKKPRGILAQAEAIHRKAQKKATARKKQEKNKKSVDLPSEWKASD